MSSEEVKDKAYRYCQAGMKYKEIAEKCGVSLSAVKSWAARYWKKDSCNPKKEKLQPQKQKVATRGAPKGNRNATGNRGGSAPLGNKNAVTTGEFETLLFDCLNEEEKRLAQIVPEDKAELLLQEIRLLTVRERRMLQRIDFIKNSVEYLTNGEPAEGMILVKYRTDLDKDEREYHGKIGQIQLIEEALTRVQGKKQKAIEALHRFGYDDARLELERKRTELMCKKPGIQRNEIEEDGVQDLIIYFPEKEI